MKNSKNYNYFKAFIDLCSYLAKAADILMNTLKNFNSSKIEEHIREMHNIEHSADIANHELINRLAKEFLPPIEREDIISLSKKIDDVTDAIEDILIAINMYNIQVIRLEVLKFIDLIMKCCKSIYTVLVEFENFKKSKNLHNEIRAIYELEEEADALYVNGVKELYQSCKDPIELMVWTEIYNRLEKCCDKCEHVADDIVNIVMKNS
ncbi:MAG: DUF47 family protein [Clostridiales bacterium]|uniref:DUF47 domain-containing protein n=1 Tax=Clostridium sp. N3C TaxID=1776758 RepID=UPI00092DEB9D|nr:DUF47 family protein [Clostridium sp. N3C]NLZ48724.1 DUF47 family protein [Clostridiales bacterium]SCN21253.1 putative pit accessory protein [Clostridium sp. N3C]